MERNGNFYEFVAQEILRVKKVMDQYSTSGINAIERFSMRIVLNMLERLSSTNRGSEELLCFGYHILAKKE